MKITVSDGKLPKMSITGYAGQSEEHLRAELAVRRAQLQPDPIEKERLVCTGTDPLGFKYFVDVLPFIRGY